MVLNRVLLLVMAVLLLIGSYLVHRRGDDVLALYLSMLGAGISLSVLVYSLSRS